MNNDPGRVLEQDICIDKLVDEKYEKFQEPVFAFITFQNAKVREIVAKYCFKKTDEA